jgi:hypothetical protein
MRLLLAISVLVLAAMPAQAKPIRYQCPTEVEPLVHLMLRDITGYGNRVLSRARSKSSIVMTGRPEFEPLPVNAGETPDPDLRQAFITTLEREWIAGKPIQIQQYHWLFLSKSDRSWQLALMFSRTGPYPAKQQPSTPPRDSSQGVMGQAIRLWLRDCNTGVIRP